MTVTWLRSVPVSSRVSRRSLGVGGREFFDRSDPEDNTKPQGGLVLSHDEYVGFS